MPHRAAKSAAIGFHLSTDPSRAGQIADILKALAHPLRIQIVAILCQGPQHVNGLAEQLGVKQSIVSQQLRILRMRRLVSVERRGGYAYYHLAEENLRTLVHCMEGCTVP